MDGLEPRDVPRATGEGFIPGQGTSELFHGHVHRYRVAAHFAAGARVLDVGCGEGYGLSMLHQAGALSGLGIDIDSKTVHYAQRRYGSLGGLRFLAGDARALPFESGEFELVVCFETIEHVDCPQAIISEIRRVTSDGGMAVISTPGKTAYNRLTGAPNPYHLHEMTGPEFQEMLYESFRCVQVLEQRLVVGSCMESRGAIGAKTDVDFVNGNEGGDGTYLIALCGNAKVEAPQSLFIDLHQQDRPARLDLLEQVHSARRQLDDYEEALREHDRARATAEAAHAKLVGDLRTVTMAYEMATSSRSWRWTSPLRAWGRFLRARS